MFSFADVQSHKDKNYSPNRQVIFPVVFVLCKKNIILLLILLNKSIGSEVGGPVVGRLVVGWSLVGGAVVDGFNKTSSKCMLG